MLCQLVRLLVCSFVAMTHPTTWRIHIDWYWDSTKSSVCVMTLYVVPAQLIYRLMCSFDLFYDLHVVCTHSELHFCIMHPCTFDLVDDTTLKQDDDLTSLETESDDTLDDIPLQWTGRNLAEEPHIGSSVVTQLLPDVCWTFSDSRMNLSERSWQKGLPLRAVVGPLRTVRQPWNGEPSSCVLLDPPIKIELKSNNLYMVVQRRGV